MIFHSLGFKMERNKVGRVIVGFMIIIVILGMDLQQPYFPAARRDTFGAENSRPLDLEGAISQLENTETTLEEE